MSEPNSGQWGKQDSGGSPSDSGAAHSPSHAFGTSLAQSLTELQRVKTSVASHFADRQDGWQNLFNDMESEFTAPPIEDNNDHTIREGEGIKDNLQRVQLAPKLEMIREWIVSIVIIATFIVMLINTVSESDDAVIINIDEFIMNVCEPCDQISYRDLIWNRND